MHRSPVLRLRSFVCIGAVVLVVGALAVAEFPSTAAPITGVTNVSAGGAHSCARLSNGTVECWGLNAAGQLGDGTTTTRSAPVAVQNETNTGSLTNVASVTVGVVSCALMNDATVRCWGDNTHGELGIGTTSGPQMCSGAPCSTLPVTVQNPTNTGPLANVTQLSVGGGSDVCARLSDATVVCWGSNASGQLSISGSADASLPSVVITGPSQPLTAVAQIAAGDGHTCARLNNGTVRCWGENSRGQLGNGTTNATPGLVRKPDNSGVLTSVIDISAGNQSTCATISDNTGRCWGSNDFGQIGDWSDTVTQRNLPSFFFSPTETQPLTDVAAVVAGDGHACARVTNGRVYCTGNNADLAVGSGAAFMTGQKCPSAAGTCTTKPIAVVNAAHTGALTGVTDLSSDGAAHTCAVLTGGQVSCWGRNLDHELGDGTALDRCVPTAPGSTGAAGTVPARRTVGAKPGADRATVNWARNDGDCATPVESYTVTDHPSGDVTTVPNTLDASGAPRTGVVILLAKGVHSFTVVASNSVGSSLAANTNAVTVGGPGTPSRPTAAPRNAAAVVQWRKPATGQSPITGYRVTPRKNGVAGPSTTFGAAALSGTVQGLQNAHVYTFTVQAINAYGPGPSSPASNAVTVGVPLAPVNLHATPAGTGSIKVAFSESGRSNGAAITKFTATCTATGGATRTVARSGASAAAITVSGLTTSRAYRCKVRATNSRGTGAWSKPSNLVRT